MKAFLANKDKFFALADSALLSLFRLGIGIVIAKTAGAESFAHYIILTSALVIFQTLPGASIITPLIHLGAGANRATSQVFFAKSHARLRRYYLWGTVVAVVAIPVVLREEVPFSIYLGFIGACLASLELNFRRSLLMARFQMLQALAVDVTIIVFVTAAILIGWQIGDQAHAAYWWSFFIASLLGSFWMARVLSQPNPKDSPQDQEVELLDQRARKQGGAMLKGSIANSVCSRLQPISLATFSTTLTVAQFGAAWTLIGPMRLLSVAFSNILRPRLAVQLKRGESDRFYRNLRLSYALISGIGVAGILYTLLAGGFTFVLLFGEEFRSAAILLIPAILYAILDTTSSIQALAIQVRDEDGAQFTARLRIVCGIVSLALLVPACYYFGAMGALCALLIVESLYIILSSRKLHRPQPSMS